MTVRVLQPESAAMFRRAFQGQDAAWSDNTCLSEEVFLKEVTSHGMAPLLYRFLAKGETGGSWPEGVLEGLREAAVRQAACEPILELDLRRLLDAFAAIGVTPLLLKGSPLSHTLYPEPGLRPRCDTDLLIPDSARQKTAALMERLGYKGLHRAEVKYINTQMCYSRKTAQGFYCSYDIHWRMSNCNRRFSRDFAGGRLLENSLPVPSLGEHARTLSRADALLYACFHRAGHLAHQGDRLIWLYDIHLLCEALTEQEAAAFCSKAKELEIVRLCADAFDAARTWFGTEFPSELAVMSEQEPGREASALLLQTGRTEGIRTHALLELHSLPTWRERFFFLLQNAFPPAEYMAWRYGLKNKFVLPCFYLRRFAEGVYIFFLSRFSVRS